MSYILIFIFGFFLGFGLMYEEAKKDIKKAKNLIHLKIMYHIYK